MSTGGLVERVRSFVDSRTDVSLHATLVDRGLGVFAIVITGISLIIVVSLPGRPA